MDPAHRQLGGCGSLPAGPGKRGRRGFGAGFPGIVVALLRPDLDVTLIETMERRTQWLSDVVEELDLDGDGVGEEDPQHGRPAVEAGE